ncbi:ATP-dependent nuclease [Spiribacter halobius]|uniref:ATP-dependent endonuclease n=1 Tax=Sediminicurvatus halobius TaxID=2182432 RepID=A0A2U2MW87_9GAMM|nr:ATP-binding protein [Spiribacter halobius]PWG61125.1 ATP-dependent endonuclease [Spiribacter halobius]UEX77715.1 AAA family ATPase [Spiribacter halobius]
MTRVTKVQIRNFRSIQSLDWCPKPGFNCMFGPGDSGKSAVLEAIAWCLSSNISRAATDADFYRLDTGRPIEISLVIADLPAELGALEPFGPFHCGFDAETGNIADEPSRDLETALSVTLSIDQSMQGLWCLNSSRVEDDNHRREMASRMLRRLSLLQLQGENASELTFGRGSVLFNLTDDRLELSGALAQAARAARDQFGDAANDQLAATLGRVQAIANGLGIDAAAEASASLDASQSTLRPGHIALQDRYSVPLTRLGLGSSRLLIAGLQHDAVTGADVGLVDELESGLEPHRIVRLLQALGAKQEETPLQVFATTHSPVVIRELSADQLVRVRNHDGEITMPRMDGSDSLQGTLRSDPEAFLAKSVLICEGAGEIGFVRGLDLYRMGHGHKSLTALGVSLVDAKGYRNIVRRAQAFHALGYRVAILRDDDRQPDPDLESALIDQGCVLSKWPRDYALEHALFLGLPEEIGLELVRRATERYGVETINEQVTNKLPNGERFDFETARRMGRLTEQERSACANAAKSRDRSWFKDRGVGVMEEIALEVIGPAQEHSEEWFQAEVNRLFDWASYDGD